MNLMYKDSYRLEFLRSKAHSLEPEKLTELITSLKKEMKCSPMPSPFFILQALDCAAQNTVRVMLTMI